MRRHARRGIVLGLSIVGLAEVASAQPLGPDPSFNTPKGFDATHSADRAIDAIVPALDGSGRVYVAGRFTTYVDHAQSSLLRLGADGSVDVTFATGQGFNNTVTALALAADGSGDLYAAGSFTAYDGTTKNRLVRLNADGSVDPAFAVGTGFNSTVNAIAVAADGSGDLYVGGPFTSYQGVSGRNRILRLNADGSVDATFAIGAGFNFPPLALAPASDGDVYVGGAFTSYKGTTGVNRIVRLNQDGSIDPGFATGAGFNLNEVNALALDPSGDLYAGGSFWKYQGLAVDRIIRLNPDGTRDTAFDGAVSGGTSIVESVVIANDGSGDVFIGGEFTSYKGLPGTCKLARVNSDGSLDTSLALGSGFEGGAYDLVSVRAIAMTVDGSGDVLAGGYFAAYDGTAVDHFVRLNWNGTLDASTRLGAGFNGNVNALAAATDGSGDLYVGGAFDWYAGRKHVKLARVNADGTADPGFVTGAGFNQQVMALAAAVDGSGDVYVGGAFYVYDVVACTRLVRLDPTGARDLAFAPSASVINGHVESVLPVSDGSGDVYAGGGFTGRIVRLSSTGAVVHAAVGAGFNGDVKGMAPAPDGSGDLIVVGAFGSYAGATSVSIIRLNADLTIDTAVPTNGFNGAVNAIAVSGASVYVGGEFTLYQGVQRMRLCRLTPALAIDYGFDPGAGPSYPTGGTSVRALLVSPSTGRLYVGGKFTTYRGVSSPGLVALSPDGSRDASFVVGTGLTRSALALAEGQDADRDLYVGGDSRAYRGATIDFVVAVDADGARD